MYNDKRKDFDIGVQVSGGPLKSVTCDLFINGNKTGAQLNMSFIKCGQISRTKNCILWEHETIPGNVDLNQNMQESQEFLLKLSSERLH